MIFTYACVASYENFRVGVLHKTYDIASREHKISLVRLAFPHSSILHFNISVLNRGAFYKYKYIQPTATLTFGRSSSLVCQWLRQANIAIMANYVSAERQS